MRRMDCGYPCGGIGFARPPLPHGTYNAPPGNAARLIKNADATYSYETLHRDQLTFNAAGRIATFQEASGVQVKFT
ncbi:hypothetical protein JOD69_005051, partial [Methylocaldum sp. RMAD-M]|nr:hypothetical protein [Methylocaldum sp. RMAD-M]